MRQRLHSHPHRRQQSTGEVRSAAGVAGIGIGSPPQRPPGRRQSPLLPSSTIHTASTALVLVPPLPLILRMLLILRLLLRMLRLLLMLRMLLRMVLRRRYRRLRAGLRAGLRVGLRVGLRLSLRCVYRLP